MNKYARCIAGAITTVIMFSSSVLANPSINGEASQVENSNGQSSQIQSSNNTLDVQIQKLEVSVEKLDSQIEEALRRIDDNNNEITKTENDIKELEKQINDAENNISEHKDLFKKRARAFYVNGVNGYLDIIIESQSLEDFISRIDSVNRILKFDESVISDLSDKKEDIVKEKEKLQEKNKLLINLKADNEKKLAKLNEDKENQKKLVEQLQIQLNAYSLNNGQLNIISSKELAPVTNDEIVNYAYDYLGVPYLWGGTTPSGFDCSGLMQYVYAHFGVSIRRVTYDQIKDGVEVPRDKLQSGDMVFFGTWDDPHHVGMYIGNGMYLHAPKTGDVVKISQLTNRNDYLTARRVK